MTPLQSLLTDTLALEAKARETLIRLNQANDFDRKRINTIRGKLIAYKHIIQLINDLIKKA